MVHYWPLLLIVWGVAKLLEHVWARQHGEPTPRLGAGGIVFPDLLHRFRYGYCHAYGGLELARHWDGYRDG